MIAQLMIEKAGEVKHKDFCVDELNTNQLQMIIGALAVISA